MKKLHLILVGLMVAVSLMAQAPQKMSYQAVVRDSDADLVKSSQVGMQISIIQTTVEGSAVYVETHSPMTNANGLVSLEIGTGSVVSGDFSAIDWSGDTYFIKTETDPAGGTNYTISGISQMLSVPYALYAESAGSTSLNQGKIFIGNASGEASEQAITGDVTISETGITAIGASKVTNDMLAGSISNDKLAGSITNEKLAGFITDDKLSNGTYMISSSGISGQVWTSDGSGAGFWSVYLGDRALITGADGNINTSAVTADELAYLSGANGNIQGQINALSEGSVRQKAVMSIITDNASMPPTEMTGDRYILSFYGGPTHEDWDGASAGDIVEFDGSTWVATMPIEGMLVYDDNTNKDYLNVDDGTPLWEERDYMTKSLSQGYMYVGNASGEAEAQSMSGDVTISETGVTAIGSSKVTNDMLAGSITNDKLAGSITNEKLAGSISDDKLAMSQGKILIGSASGTASEQAITGDVTISDAGVTAIGSSKVTNDMLAGAISDDKLSNPNKWTTNSSTIHYNAGNVGIGTDSPSASAILELNSSTKGFLPPRLTSTQRDAMTGLTTGLMIFNSTENKLQMVVPADGEPLLDQSQEIYNTYSSGNYYQSFTPAVSGKISKVSFRINNPDSDGLGTVKLQIFSGEKVESGKLVDGDQLLGESAPVVPEETYITWCDFDLSSLDLILTAGELYTMKLYTDDETQTWIAFTNTDAYAGGRSGISSSWDLLFKTYMPGYEWANVQPEVPTNISDFTNDAGYLTAESELPTQTGQAGKFLTTDGSSPSWTSISSIWTQSESDAYFNEENIGIGTTTPAYKLDVQASTNNWAARIRNTGEVDPQGLLVESTNTSSYATFGVKTGESFSMVVNGDGKVGIGTQTPAEKLDVDGVVLSKFEGFSYYTVGTAVVAQEWQSLKISKLDYNTISGYDTVAGTFTAPRDGFYRFTISGYALMYDLSYGGTLTQDQIGSERYAMGIMINTTLKSFSGGNYSYADSPMSTYSQVVRLSVGDVVTPRFYSAFVVTLGGETAGHEFWFQGEYVGK